MIGLVLESRPDPDCRECLVILPFRLIDLLLVQQVQLLVDKYTRVVRATNLIHAQHGVLYRDG